MSLTELIPKDKSDVLSAYRLEDYNYHQIKSIVPQLMEWLKDINWPVVEIIAENLLRMQDNLENEIMYVLNSDDGIWKYWIISIFGNSTKSKLIQQKIIEIATNPNIYEINCETNVAAQKVINSAKWY